jgi:hypothetical protein
VHERTDGYVIVSNLRDVHVFTQLHQEQGKVKEELEKFDYCLAYEIVEFVRKISVRVQVYTIEITHSITQTVATRKSFAGDRKFTRVSSTCVLYNKLENQIGIIMINPYIFSL